MTDGAVRAKMRMRATITRETQVDRNGFGQKTGDLREVKGWVPCYVWAGSGGSHETNELDVSTDQPGGIVPIGTDIKPGDLFGPITNKKLEQLFPQMTVKTVLRRRSHLALVLVAVMHDE